MDNTIKKGRILFVLSLVWSILGISILAGCDKEDPTVVTITVIDSVGARVSNANVRVYSKPSDTTRAIEETRFDEVKVSNSSGMASFDYSEFTKPGQAGFAVLDIEVVKGVVDTSGTDTTYFTGIGQVRVEEEKNNTKTIRVQ